LPTSPTAAPEFDGEDGAPKLRKRPNMAISSVKFIARSKLNVDESITHGAFYD
jgi:hypothetical protein